MFSKTLSVVSFFGALAIGVAAAWFGSLSNESAVLLEGVDRSGPPMKLASVKVAPEDFVGRWRGTFGYGDKEAMIYIDRVEGNKFYGNLTVHGALIALEGTVDSNRQEISFRETKVLSIDRSLGGWSLGRDSGSYSTDGKEMYGIGRDEYGTYEWSMTKDN